MRLCSGAATGTGEPTVSLNGSPAKGSVPTHSRARSCTSHLPSSTTGPVQTQQPCSLKGSLSSDNIYAGLHGDSTGTHAQPGQGDHQRHTAEHLIWTVFYTNTRLQTSTVLILIHQRINIKHSFVVFCLMRLDISVCCFLTLMSSSLFDYTSSQAGLIILKHLREWPISRVASRELDFSVGLCLCLSVCISSLLA